MRSLWVRLGILFFFLSFVSPIMAAKPRIRVQAAAAHKTTSTSSSLSSAKLSKNTHSIILNLPNLTSVKKVAYELDYTANGIPEGAMGSITVNGQTSESRDLYFGTCSKGVCTPHTNISGATLTVRITKTNGTVSSKRYLIKTSF